MPLGHVGKRALLVVELDDMIRNGHGQVISELGGIGVSSNGHEVFAGKLEIDGLVIDCHVNPLVPEFPFAGDRCLPYSLSSGDDGATSGGRPMGLFKALEIVRTISAKVQGELVAGIHLVRVATAGGIVPVEIRPVDHTVEGLHEANCRVRDACADHDG